MRLQFLGDLRDAFKWDLLHWVCTESYPPYARVIIVPMLNPDDPDSSHGRTTPEGFDCRPAILRFLQLLRNEPRQIDLLKNLGKLEDLGSFEVSLYQPNRFISSDWSRAHYWEDLEGTFLQNSLVFVDPDTGFETRTQAGEKHLRFGEALDLLNRVDQRGCLVVFQYRPQGQPWRDVVKRISGGGSLGFFRAVLCGNTGLVIMAKNEALNDRVDRALTAYGSAHPEVQIINNT